MKINCDNYVETEKCWKNFACENSGFGTSN